MAGWSGSIPNNQTKNRNTNFTLYQLWYIYLIKILLQLILDDLNRWLRGFYIILVLQRINHKC